LTGNEARPLIPEKAANRGLVKNKHMKIENKDQIEDTPADQLRHIVLDETLSRDLREHALMLLEGKVWVDGVMSQPRRNADL
jgi:hypothetical protein